MKAEPPRRNLEGVDAAAAGDAKRLRIGLFARNRNNLRAAPVRLRARISHYNVGHWCAVLRDCNVTGRGPEGGTRARNEFGEIVTTIARKWPDLRKGPICALQLHMTSLIRLLASYFSPLSLSAF